MCNSHDLAVYGYDAVLEWVSEWVSEFHLFCAYSMYNSRESVWWWFQKKQARSILFHAQQRIVLFCFTIWTSHHAHERTCWRIWRNMLVIMMKKNFCWNCQSQQPRERYAWSLCILLFCMQWSFETLNRQQHWQTRWRFMFATLRNFTHTHSRLTALFPGLPRVSRYQKGKTNLDFTEARVSEWQWHQLGHMHDEEHNDIVTRSTATAQKA